MSQILYLNKQVVDLNNKPLTRKLQISDISDISKRKSTHSYTLRLQKTSKNFKILDMAGVSGNTSRKPFEYIAADYVVDGIPLVRNGIAIISSIDRYINIVVYDGLKELSYILDDSLISELPSGTIDHVLTGSRFRNSLDYESEYTYPLANYGYDHDPAQGFRPWIVIEEQSPCLFVHSLLRKIFESNNLNLIGSFFEENINFKKEVITPFQGYDIIDEVYEEESNGTCITDSLVKNKSYNSFRKESVKLNINDIDLYNIGEVNGELNIGDTGTFILTLNTDYDSVDIEKPTDITIEVRVNDIVKGLVYLDNNYTQSEVEITLELNTNDVVSFYLNASTKVNDIIEDDGVYKLDYVLISEISIVKVTSGNLIKALDYIGEIKQIDFIKEVLIRYGLILQPILNSNEFRFKRIEEVLTDFQRAEDWSEKLKEISGEKYKSGYNKNNFFKYKYQDIDNNVDFLDFENIDGNLKVDNINAKLDKDIFESSFEVAGKKTASSYYFIPVHGTDNVANIINKETPMKYMFVDRVTGYFTMRLFGLDESLSISSNIPKLSTDNISFEDYINDNYDAFSRLLNDYKELNIKVNLSKIDIYLLDFFKLKYLNQTGRYYYIDTVTNTEGKLSQVKLIEIR